MTICDGGGWPALFIAVAHGKREAAQVGGGILGSL